MTYARHPNGLELHYGADGQAYYRRPGMLGWAPLPKKRTALGPRGRVGVVGVGFNFFKDVCCDSGSAVSKVTTTVASPFVAAGAVVNNVFGGTFIGAGVRAAGRVAQTGLDTVNKAAKSVGDDLAKVPVIGGALSAVYDVATDPITLPLQAADDVVHGDSPAQVISDSIHHEVTKFKAAAPYVESVVALIPGVGGMCASCIAVGVGVAEGESIDQIVVDAAAAQIPGGPIVVAGYRAAKTILSGKARPISWDTIAVGALQGIAKAGGVTIPPEATSALRAAAKFGSDIANGKSAKEAGLDSLVAAIPTSTQAGKALHSAVAVALAETKQALQGSKAGDALFAYGITQVPTANQQDVQKGLTTAIGFVQASNLQAAKTQAVPGLLTKLQAVGAADVTPIVAAARTALGGKGVTGFDVGHGLMQYQGDLFQTKNLRAQLGNAADQHGFDVALALKIGNVASTLPFGLSNSGVAAGMLIGAGAQTASDTQKATIHGAVAKDPAVATGIAVVHTRITGLEWAALGALAAGTALAHRGHCSPMSHPWCVAPTRQVPTIFVLVHTANRASGY